MVTEDHIAMYVYNIIIKFKMAPFFGSLVV